MAFEALLRHELGRFFSLVEERFDEADMLEDLLVVGAVESARFLLGHEALGYLLRHEPHRVIPAYGHLQGGLAIATGFLVPHLARFVDDRRPRCPRAPSWWSACCCPMPPTPARRSTSPTHGASAASCARSSSLR